VVRACAVGCEVLGIVGILYTQQRGTERTQKKSPPPRARGLREAPPRWSCLGERTWWMVGKRVITKERSSAGRAQALHMLASPWCPFQIHFSKQTRLHCLGYV